MSTLDLRNAKRLFYGGVEARQLYYGSQLLWTRPEGSTWTFLTSEPAISGYSIVERTSSRLVFTRNQAVRSYLMFAWGLPVGTRLQFQYTASGPARLWSRFSPDNAGMSVSSDVFNRHGGPVSVDAITSTAHSFFGFLTAAGENSSLTTYTIENLVVTPPG